MTDKPKNKQMLTIITTIVAVFIVWLFLRSRTARLNNVNDENQVITNPADTSWLDKLLDGLAAAGAPFNINIPAMLGYVPKDYPINLGNSNNYTLPHPNYNDNSGGAGCSFCMKTPEGLPPVSKPAPAPAPIIPPPRPMMSFGSSRAVVPYSPPPIYPWSTGRM